MRTLARLAVLLLVVAGCVHAEQLLIAFASNLDSSGGCHRDDWSGADLYTVVLDLNDMRVSDLTRITNTPSEADWFPSISPDGRVILFNRSRRAPRSQTVHAYDRNTGSEHLLLSQARFPNWSSNTEFCYSDIQGRHDCHWARVTFNGGKVEISDSQPVTSQTRCPETGRASDPSPFPDGSRIAFHALRNGSGAAVAMMNTDGTGYRRITPWNGAGHCDVSPTGNYIIFSMSSNGLPHVVRKSDDWANPIPLPLGTDGTDWVSYDERYAAVPRVGLDYGEWAGNDQRILFSGQGFSGGTVFSRLFLFTFNDGFTSVEIFDLSSAIEALAGKTGRDFCTGFAVEISPRAAPRFSSAGVVNAASYAGGAVAPSEIITIFGVGIGPESLTTMELTPNGRHVRDSLAGTRVLFDGTPSPLLYVSSTQTSAVVPAAVAGKTVTQARSEYLGALSEPVALPVALARPGIFTEDASGQGQGAILHWPDYDVNGPDNPAARGSVVMTFATSGGPTQPASEDGRIVAEPQALQLPVSAAIGGVPATVSYAGAAPNLVTGVLQVNITIPENAPTGDAVPLVVTVGGAESQPGVTIAIR